MTTVNLVDNGLLKRYTQNSDGSVTQLIDANSSPEYDTTNTVVPVALKPVASATYAPSNATVIVYSASKIIKAGAGILFGISGYNSNSSAQFIQLHDSATLPANTAVPAVLLTVPGNGNFSINFGNTGRYFTTGIVVCNSSTGATKTSGGSDCWFDAQYV